MKKQIDIRLHQVSDNQFSDEQIIPEVELLKDYRRVQLELGRDPSANDINERGKYHSTAYERRYGNWAKFREIMGNPIEFPEGPFLDTKIISEVELLRDYRRVQLRLGRDPSSNDINDHGKYHSSTYARRYGSWTRFREIMGNPVKDHPSKEDLISNYFNVKNILGRTPNGDELSKFGIYGKRTYHKHFGCHKKLLEFLGEKAFGKESIVENFVANYFEVRNILGRIPSREELAKYGAYGDKAHILWCKYFGGYRNFLDFLGEKSQNTASSESSEDSSLNSSGHEAKPNLENPDMR